MRYVEMATVVATTVVKHHRRRSKKLGPGQFCDPTKARGYRLHGYTCVPEGARGRLKPR